MNKKILHIIILISVIISTPKGMSQDIHFSQYYMTPNIINPASIGTFKGDFRGLINFKDQWRQIQNTYRTVNATFDAPIFRDRLDNKVMGIGGSIYRDVAGDSKTTTLNISAGSSYTFNLSREIDLTFGLSLSYLSLTANYQGLAWGSQYNGIEYVPTLPTGETFVGLNQKAFDANIGGLFRVYDYNGYPWEFGLSVSHLPRPKVGIVDGNDAIPLKYIFHSSKVFEMPNTDWATIYHVMYARQLASTELNLGGMIRRTLGQERSKYTGYYKGTLVYGGLFGRISNSNYKNLIFDALIFHGLLNYKEKYLIGISYDFNISRLNSATLYRGGFELSLGYSGFIDSRYQVVSPRAF